MKMLVTACLVAELVSINLALIAPTTVITHHLSQVLVNSLSQITNSVIKIFIVVQTYITAEMEVMF